MFSNLLFPSLIAGFLTFLAPCTLPIVPAYLAFIAGVPLESLKNNLQTSTRKKIILNALAYCFGFSLIFIFFGTIFSFGGAHLIQYKSLINKIGAFFILLFGLYMIGLLKIRFFDADRVPPFISKLKPGSVISSFLFGVVFATGWSPCVGPILGSVLLLASQSQTVFGGAILLAIFSLGISIPFMVVALGIGFFSRLLIKTTRIAKIFSIVAGILLCVVALMILFDKFGYFVEFFYRIFEKLGYEKLLNYL